MDGAFGIEELYAAYTGANLSAADWDGDRYYRLRTINSLRSRGLIDDNLRYAARTIARFTERWTGSCGAAMAFTTET